MLRLLLIVLAFAKAGAASMPLIPGDPIDCFAMSGPGMLSKVDVSGMPFTRALHVKTGTVAISANPWDIRPRCFNTAAAAKDDTILAVFWMRTTTTVSSDGKGLTTFVLERNDSPYTKSVTFTTAAGVDWKRIEMPFRIAEGYAANAYNFSFWVTFANQEIEIGGLTVQNYGPNVPFSELNLASWPYEGHDASAPWRAAAAQRIERYHKGDIVIVVKDESGNPVPAATVHLKMKNHAFGFGTAVAGDVIQRTDADGQNYRAALKRLFNKVVTENALKWPFFEAGWGKQQADFMLPWFAANGFQMVRGHNVIWPGLSNLPQDVQSMLKSNPVDKETLRKRIDDHIATMLAYTKDKVTEWDVLNEPVTNTDIQAALGNAEMAVWFQKAKEADPSIKLYVNDYNIVEAGGYDLQHINAFYTLLQQMLANGAPIDGIGLQSHFDTNLTPPDRVYELLDKWASFGKDLQVTEFDVSPGDEQVQADYTRDYLTICFSHPAVRGFLIWGFWEGAHWRPQAAMIRKDWTTKPNYDVWNDLIYKQWWTDIQGQTGPDGVFRARGFLGGYDVDVTANGTTRTYPLSFNSNSQPTYVQTGKTMTGVIAPNGIVNAASFQPGPVAPGEMITIFGTGFGPATVAKAAYDDTGFLPTMVGDTGVLFDGVAAPMIYSVSGQVSAIVPYSVQGSTSVQVEYQGISTNPVSLPVATAAPGVFACATRVPFPPPPAVLVNFSAPGGPKISCQNDYVAPGPASIVGLFITGEGQTQLAIETGKLPKPPEFPAPAQPIEVTFGGIPAQPCPLTFSGLVYAGVTQLNVCVPQGVPDGASVPITVSVGGITSVVASTAIQSNWKVIWSDEFDGPAGSLPDPKKWTYDLGGGSMTICTSRLHRRNSGESGCSNTRSFFC
jgi:uncharacterized protein (TIGR03437 family)